MLPAHDVFLLVFQFLLEHDVVSCGSMFRFYFGDVFKPLVSLVNLHGVIYPYIK